MFEVQDRKAQLARCLRALALLSLTGALWCLAYHRWTAVDWSAPLTYDGDSLWEMASAKACAEGDILPVLPKYPKAFGAPFTANWNDYPSVEEGILGWSGLLTRIFGVFAGANVTVLSAHVLAALAFYFVCRRLRYDWIFAFAGALVFAFSRYAFSRSLAHVGLTYYWHIPLGILVFWWCVAKAPLQGARKWALCVGIAVLYGVQNPYYTGMFMQLLAWAAFVQLLRRSGGRRVVTPLILFSATVLTFLLMNVDTFSSRLVNGVNTKAVARDYAGLEYYALKPIELLLPVVHQIKWLHDWARETYFMHTMLIGEAGSPYLGIVGIAALVWLIACALRPIARGGSVREIPAHFWLVLWVLAYSVVGGVNGIVGFVMELFRGTNRYSIVILSLLLLFLVRQLTARTTRWSAIARIFLATAIVVVGLFDQFPPAMAASIAPVAAAVSADRAIAHAVEEKLPADSMIFQLPVQEFPEGKPIEQMGSYEHFRPYLHTNTLRYSFGSVRGRSREAWQLDAAQQPAPRLIAMLESYRFAAVWINRNGYADKAAALVKAIAEADRTDVLAQNDTFVCIALKPAQRPVLPPEFGTGWYRLESAGDQDWRWAAGTAELVLHNGTSAQKSVRIAFSVSTAKPRRLVIKTANATLEEMSLPSNAEAVPVEFSVVLAPGRNLVRFETDVQGELPPNGDPRPLAFCVKNFKIEE